MNVVIWSKVNCPQCDKAKSLLASKDIQFSERKISTDTGYSVEDLLALVPTAKSVPQIFIDDKHIGGYNELVEIVGEL